MRSKNTIKNMRYNFLLYFVSIILGFISRSFFIKYLGIDILGVNNIIGNLLEFLNIAESGVSLAITYSLYGPLAKKDNRKIEEIMYLFKYYYKKIALIIFILGAILSIFLKFMMKKEISLISIYIYYYLFLFNTVLTYLFSYKQTLIIADQKEYIITLSTNLIKLIKVIMEIIVLINFRNYILWIFIEVIFNYINLIYLSKKCERIFKNIDFKKKYEINTIKEKNSNIIIDIKNVFLHKISNFIVFQTDNILISLFLTLKDVGIYGNYILIISSISGILFAVMNSIIPSIGNLIVKSTTNKVYEVFKKMYLLDNFFALIISYTLFYTINPFMSIWVGKDLTFGYGVVYILMVNLYIKISRGTVDRFRDVYGIFWDKYAPVVEGIVNLVISLILIRKMGIIGILSGTLVSNILIVLIWKPYTLFSYGFKIDIKKYIFMFLKTTIASLISIYLSNYILKYIPIISFSNNLLEFIIRSIVIFVIIGAIGTIIYLIQKDFRDLIKYIIKTIYKR